VLTDFRAEFEKAEHAIQVGRSEAALQIIKGILSADPEDSFAYFMLARAQLLKENVEAAMEALEASIRLNPEYPSAHALYGYLLGTKHDLTGAYRALQIALELNPFHQRALNWYAKLLLNEEQQPHRAKEFAERALRVGPEEPDHHVLMGNIFERLQMYPEAESAFREALRLEPEDADALNDYGVFLMNAKKQPKEAFTYFRESLRLDPTSECARENFLISLQAKSKFFGLFWRYSCMMDRLGRRRLYFILGIWLLMRVLILLARHAPFLMPVLLPLVLLYILFCIYTWAAKPLFNFMIKRGWIR
jgi:Tfp pilus assembly protein PilF